MLKNPKIWLVLATIYTIVLLYFSLSNFKVESENPSIPHLDKLLHFCAYILLEIFWGIYLLYKGAKNPLRASFIATLIFGILLECFQEWINPLRMFDLYDLYANCVGVAIGTIIVHYLSKSKVKLI